MRRASGKISPSRPGGAWKNAPEPSSVFIIFRLINTTNSWQQWQSTDAAWRAYNRWPPVIISSVMWCTRTGPASKAVDRRRIHRGCDRIDLAVASPPLSSCYSWWRRPRRNWWSYAVATRAGNSRSTWAAADDDGVFELITADRTLPCTRVRCWYCCRQMLMMLMMMDDDLDQQDDECNRQS